MKIEPSTTSVVPGEYKPIASEDIAIALFNMYDHLEHVPKPYKDHIQWLVDLEYRTLVCSGDYNY